MDDITPEGDKLSHQKDNTSPQLSTRYNRYMTLNNVGWVAQ